MDRGKANAIILNDFRVLYAINTRIYNLRSRSHFIHFLAVVAEKLENLEQMFVLKQENIAGRQQMPAVNLLQKCFKQLSYYTVSNWYYTLMQLLSVTKSSII